MATIDPNGVLIYQDTDNYTPIQTALNLAQSNLSALLGANAQIVKAANAGDRNAKAAARGSISKANPFVVWRADALDGLQLEYTTNGATWRVIADKEYYDSRNIGWTQVTPAAGWNSNFWVCRRGDIVYHRGLFSPSGDISIPSGTWQAVGTIPVGFQSSVGLDLLPTASLIGGFTGIMVSRVSVGGTGLIEICPTRAASTLSVNSVVSPAIPPTTTNQ